MESFTDALKQGNLEKIRAFPKSDLHNHFVLGGSRQYLHKMTGIKIEPVKTPILSMDEMHAWNRENLGERFETSEMRKLLIRATLHQAREDGVTVLEIGEDVWGLSEYFHNDIDELIEAFTTAQREIAPDIELRLQIGLSRHCPIGYLQECLSYFWGNRAFYSIDLYGDELAQPIENFKSIYRSGVDVTINSDDILIFDSDVSKEYLRLYESGCLSAEELDSIRQNGLIAR